MLFPARDFVFFFVYIKTFFQLLENVLLKIFFNIREQFIIIKKQQTLFACLRMLRHFFLTLKNIHHRNNGEIFNLNIRLFFYIQQILDGNEYCKFIAIYFFRCLVGLFCFLCKTAKRKLQQSDKTP